MIKEFEIKEILNAVNSIYRIERKKLKSSEYKNDTSINKHVLDTNNQAISKKTEILVLDDVIE